MSKKQVFISWAAFQRRNVSIAPYFGIECFFLGDGSTASLLWVYFKKFIRTLAILFAQRPDVVWVQVPPLPALTATLLYKLLAFKKVIIVADCHNSMLRPPWSTLPTALWHLNWCNLVLVHNIEQNPVIRNMGVLVQCLVLEDAPATLDVSLNAGPKNERPRCVFPASFAEDEPISELLAAAKKMPSVDFYITGNMRRAIGKHDLSNISDNVHLTGFLSLKDFDSLFSSSDVVIGLTRFDGIQLSVCNEAVGAGKPMVLSDTTILRSLFSRGAIFVDSNSSDDIARGCKAALDNKELLAKDVVDLCISRRVDWQNKQASVVKEFLQ
jgi:hypothetical protein